MEATEWRSTTALLHLTETLKESAQNCGRATMITDVFEVLRAQYGLHQVKRQLNILLKEPVETLQEHATDVRRLVGRAYSDLPDD